MKNTQKKNFIVRPGWGIIIPVLLFGGIGGPLTYIGWKGGGSFALLIGTLILFYGVVGFGFFTKIVIRNNQLWIYKQLPLPTKLPLSSLASAKLTHGFRAFVPVLKLKHSRGSEDVNISVYQQDDLIKLFKVIQSSNEHFMWDQDMFR